MAQSFEITQRQFVRAEASATAAAATPPTEQVALKAVLPEVMAHCQSFKVADSAVKSQERVTAKEVDEAVRASKPLRSFYDQTREVLMAKVPGQTYPASVTLKTPDDAINACEDVEDVLEERQGESWAKPLFDKMVPLLDSAVREQAEASVAMQTLQKVKAQRKAVALGARPTFVHFRRVVRATFGRTSKEYRSLLDRRGIAAEDDVETSAAPTTPPTP